MLTYNGRSSLIRWSLIHPRRGAVPKHYPHKIKITFYVSNRYDREANFPNCSFNVNVSDDALFVGHQPRSSTLTVMYNPGRLLKNYGLFSTRGGIVKRQKHILLMFSIESQSHWSKTIPHMWKVAILFACCSLNAYVPILVCLPLSPPTLPGWVISPYTHRE